MSKRILLILPQTSFDFASGAALSARILAETLANNHYQVTILCPTANESDTQNDQHQKTLDQFNITPNQYTLQNQTIYNFNHKNIEHHILHAQGSPTTWLDNNQAADTFEQLIQQQLQSFNPHLVFTYGGAHRSHNWINLIKQSNASLALLIYNYAYSKSHQYLHAADLVIVPSQHTANYYLQTTNTHCVAIPSPVFPEVSLAPEPRDPVFLTMINPSIEKGLHFATQLAHQLATQRPDIPMLFVEGRGSTGHLLASAKEANIDLTKHPSIMIAQQTHNIREVYRISRTIIMPSIFNESYGRVAAEALINSIPIIASDRGALPEIIADNGFVLPFPPHINLNLTKPVSPEDVQPWLDLIIKLTDDQTFYTQAAQNAKAATPRFSNQAFTQKLLTSINHLTNQTTPST
ncbi:glycosyltransferase family 4 protein [Planctomycetota bacterium]|nr:glycosyltransferase family 4 protein [Planctomycetota bacterium]